MKQVFYFLVLPLLSGFQMIQGQVLKGDKVAIQLNNLPEMSDTRQPTITIITPQLENGVYFRSSEPEIMLYGKVWDESGVHALSVDSEIIDFSADGGFVISRELKTGQNRLKLIAVDKKNNLKELTLYVDYFPPEPTLADKINKESVYYALIIGIDQYIDNRLNDLDNPVKDSKKLMDALTTNYTFNQENIIFLQNATRAEMIRSFDELSLKITPNDNLLIYYAGHGTWDEKSNNGYWLPSDAERDVKTNWVRNSTVVDYMDEIQSRHTLLIADACFGGTIFKTRSAFVNQEFAYEQLYVLPSRKAMTSGTLTEVPDRSSFTKYLLERLNDNEKQYLSSEELYSSFRIAVSNNSKALPQYGDIENVGDQGGDFIFLRRKQ